MVIEFSEVIVGSSTWAGYTRTQLNVDTVSRLRNGVKMDTAWKC